MFTGIIEKVGGIRQTETLGESSRIHVETGFRDLELGESVAVNGVCLTVAENFGESGAVFFLSAETLSRSNLSRLVAGSRVNLERALDARQGAASRLSGHIVQGHVDGLARFAQVAERGGTHWLEIELPSSLSRYCVEKGPIALNGVSLTINRISGNTLELALIPHTWEHTGFSDHRPGDPFNVEVDVLAKYVEKLCQPYLKP